MKNITKSVLSLLLVLIFLFSWTLPVFSAESSEILVYSDTANSGVRHQQCTTLEGTGADDYYTDGVYDPETLSQLRGDELMLKLRELMTSTHTKRTNYDNCRDYSPITDCQNADATSVVLLYTSFVTSMDYWSSKVSNGWNREHVWPQSLGGFGTSKGGADLHHVRPADSSINSSRGDKLYGYSNSTNVSKGSSIVGGMIGGTYNNTYFEPHDNVKGDVARICLYVYVRWGAEYPGFCDDITNVFQSIEVLLEWCALDPVDTWEMGRNEVVEAIQGNRNVFIDYPEYAWLIFSELDENGEETRPLSNKLETPSGLANEIGINVCEHENKDYVNKAYADCTNDGYTGDLYCPDCEETLEVGTVIPKNENLHKFVEWTPTEDGFSYERECGICGEHQIISVNNIFDRIDSDAEKILLILTLAGSDFLFTDALVGETEKQ